ncbi:hypothetical protein [Bizionia myxarmorum]|uniref:Uncharacterized protein n=1 Tax=Bizionia myxarmorum TaxID=291186 RepID=A0A5D0RB59_9FLAO|nr:hypothetical protein [Bizionia myxarmorum]TYB78319.1 hypothetical protein ES674_00635 [Bizionia myxarmorum]
MNLKNGYDHLKFVNPNTGQFCNPVWFSILTKDHHSVKSIETAMLRRFSKSQYIGATRNVQFYDNQNKTLINEYPI